MSGRLVSLGLLLCSCEPALSPIVDGEKHVEATTQLCWEHADEVDLLFVIDDSPSMAEEQERLAANLGALVDQLEEVDAELDYRIGITSTSVGSACGQGGGALLLSSCLGRLEGFATDGAIEGESADASAVCVDACGLDDLATVPTDSPNDEVVRARPWIEHRRSPASQLNLPEGVTPQQAMTCGGLLGISGCEYESPLAAVRRVVEASFDTSAPEYGFLRPTASLFIVIITDEAECSINDPRLLDPQAGPSLWPDPDAQAAPSAVCWNAGVACEGGPGVYDTCEAVDVDLAGAEASAGDAVLDSLDGFENLIESLRNSKEQMSTSAWVGATVVAGVPSGYFNGGASILYSDAADPDYQAEFGIGPGCSSDGDAQTAVPPVRLREWLERTNPAPLKRAMHSVCDDDYTRALEPLAKSLVGQIRPYCFRHCARDAEPATDGLQPNCIVRDSSSGGESSPLAECELVGGEWALPDGEDGCYYLLTDATQSDSPLDDMSAECISDGFNVEARVLRREGFPFDGCTELTCEVSESPTIDCPEM